MQGRVRLIFTAPEEKVPMETRLSARAIVGAGLEGDRYAKGTGEFSNSKREVIRHITLISAEAIRDANEGLKEEEKFRAQETRRNVVVSGLGTDYSVFIGRDLRIGPEVIIRGVEDCVPCVRPGEYAGKKDLDFAKRFQKRGGLRAEIIKGGTISCFNLVVPL